MRQSGWIVLPADQILLKVLEQTFVKQDTRQSTVLQEAALLLSDTITQVGHDLINDAWLKLSVSIILLKVAEHIPVVQIFFCHLKFDNFDNQSRMAQVLGHQVVDYFYCLVCFLAVTRVHLFHLV